MIRQMFTLTKKGLPGQSKQDDSRRALIKACTELEAHIKDDVSLVLSNHKGSQGKVASRCDEVEVQGPETYYPEERTLTRMVFDPQQMPTSKKPLQGVSYYLKNEWPESCRYEKKGSVETFERAYMGLTTLSFERDFQAKTFTITDGLA